MAQITNLRLLIFPHKQAGDGDLRWRPNDWRFTCAVERRQVQARVGRRDYAISHLLTNLRTM